MIPKDVLARLARETGETLGELGVRPADRDWIGRHVRAIVDLSRPFREGRGRLARLYRRARRAARTAR